MRRMLKRSLTLTLALTMAMTMAAQLPSDSVAKRGIEALGVTFSANNTVVFFPNGAEKYKAMFHAIRQAKNYIHLEYFNFRNDSIGNALFDLLAEKVREGVKVRAIYDSFGNMSNDSPLKKKHLKKMREQGIEIYEFDKIIFPYLHQGFHRDHCKVVVIDGAVAYAGGMNVADYYIHGRPEYGEWRDMHMELTGDVVEAYEHVFSRMWWTETKEILLDEDYCMGSPLQRKASEFDLVEDTTATAHKKLIGVVHRRPYEESEIMKKAYIACIDAAQERIQIVNPYPTNVRKVRQALYRALERGVKVEFMISKKMDEPLTPEIVALEMKHMVERGAEVFMNKTGFHHSKIMMVDNRFCTVGSANLDGRSMLCDYEVNSFIFDQSTTAQLQQILEQDKKNCVRYTLDTWNSLTKTQRFNAHFFGLFKVFW